MSLLKTLMQPPGLAGSPQTGVQGWLANPLTSLGMGILAASGRPGATTASALGEGGMMGMQQIRRNQLVQDELQQRQAQAQQREAEAVRLEQARQAYVAMGGDPQVAQVLGLEDITKELVPDTPEKIKTLEMLQERPDLAALDRAQRASGAMNIELGGAFKAPQGSVAQADAAGNPVSVHFVPGTPQYEAKRAEVQSMDRALAALSQFRENIIKYGTAEYWGEGKAQMDIQRAELTRALSVLDEAGVLGDEEREFYMGQIHDPGDLLAWATKEATVESGLGALEERFLQARENAMSSLQGTPYKAPGGGGGGGDDDDVIGEADEHGNFVRY